MLRHHQALLTLPRVATAWVLPPGDLAWLEAEPWFAAGWRFADEWDAQSFDPQYETPPLEDFVDDVVAVVRR